MSNTRRGQKRHKRSSESWKDDKKTFHKARRGRERGALIEARRTEEQPELPRERNTIEYDRG